MEAGEPNDPGNVARIASGDRDAIRAFYGRTSAQAYGLALRILDSGSEAERACETAFAELPSLASAVEDERQLEIALLGRVRSEAISRLDPGDVKGRSTAEANGSYTVVNTVRESMMALDGTARRLLELAYFGGMTVAQIAEVAGMDAGQVRRTLRETLLALGAAARAEEERAR